MNNPYITPKMKVFELLKYYPEIENDLIEFVPEFKKLQNPILRKTITRVTSLEQAAKVGAVRVETLINFLREKAGQESIPVEEKQESTVTPNWFNASKIVKVLDVRPFIEAGEHPIGLVLEEVGKLNEDEILEIITPFYPAPLIDTIAGRGFDTFSENLSPIFIKSYFHK
jgi:uncharacterized protein YjaG (DUF416 family)